MFTSSYFQFKGAGRIGISRGMPRGVPAGFRRYAPLVPGEWLWSPKAENQDTYRTLYFAQLNALDPARVIADFQRLAGAAEPVILCFCDLTKRGAWCHRRMVAEFITDQTGIEVPEMTAASVKVVWKREQLALF